MTTSANDAAADDPITVLVTEGTPNEGTLTVRVTWAHRDELRDLLVGEGLRVSDVMEFSTGADLLAILDVGMPATGGLVAVGLALKKALESFVELQKARKYHFKVGDVEVDTEATSRKEVDRLIDKAVDAAIELQRHQDAAWAKVHDKLSREHNEPPVDGSATSSN